MAKVEKEIKNIPSVTLVVEFKGGTPDTRSLLNEAAILKRMLEENFTPEGHMEWSANIRIDDVTVFEDDSSNY